ncbi:MAG: hypothetical protein KC586_24150 [Myxococcales bacterium]|nr:hypothetical protein [Myxococcales bacterium]
MSTNLRSLSLVLLVGACASPNAPSPAEPAPVATQHGATSGGAGPVAPQGGDAHAEALPEQPSRRHVADVMRGLAPLVEGCVTSSGPPREIVQVAITLVSDGHVVEARFDAPTSYDRTAEGACILETVRQATFLPFRRPDFRVSFPFRVRH